MERTMKIMIFSRAGHGEYAMSRKKAFIFSLDVVVALFIMSFVLLISLYYVTRSDVGSVSNIQMLRAGYDAITSLEQSSTLQGFDKDEIEEALYDVLPVSYHMRLQVAGGLDIIMIETATAIPQDRFVASGKRFFVGETGAPGMVQFWIWVK